MLHVSLLGGQAITQDGRAGARPCSSRAIALIAFLVLHAPSPQARQRIAGLFWPDSGDGQALTNLRRELHHLRQVLGDEPPLVVTSRDLRWCDTATCQVDLRIFTAEREAALAAAKAKDSPGTLAHAAAAVAQYRGELLPGAYDEWLLDARSELERQCAHLCGLLGQERARGGDLAGAAEVLRRRIQLQPLEEAGYRALMRVLADLGDRAGALSTYHHCASILESELGIVPDPATQQEFQRLMARASRRDTDPAAARTRASPARDAATGPRSPARSAIEPRAARSGPHAAQLVGRSREVGLLQDLWQNASAGQPGLVLVRGGAGVGKTRLVVNLAEAARRHGAVVAVSQCFGASGRLALAPVADWLRTPAVQSATGALDPVWRTEVSRLVPSDEPPAPPSGQPPGGSLPGQPPAGGAAGPARAARARRATAFGAMDDAWLRHRFFEGLARALLAADRPMLLVLDNMHWCDQETLAFLTYFLGRAAGAPVLVAGTLRDDDLDQDPDLARWTARMRGTGLLTELALNPLETPDTKRLAEAISGQPLPRSEADLLQATTGGFPLYVIEAVRGTVDPTKTARPAEGLASVLRNRLEQATPAAREIAGLAAAVGTDFTLDLLTEASDLDAELVVTAVDELWRRRIVRELGTGYDFSHDLLRDTAYAQVSPPKRWLLHRRVAQGLELLHADAPDRVAAQLAGQYARGGRPDRAVTYYRRAADVAASMFAHAEAIRLHREALSIIASLPAGADRDSKELAVLEAMAAPLNARYGYASPVLQQTIERSVALAEALGRTDSMLTSLVALWASRFVQGRMSDAYETATRALTLADRGTELSGPAHFAVGGSAVYLGRPAEGLRHLDTAVQQSGDAVALIIGTRSGVHATAWAAHAHWLLGRDAEALQACDQAIKLARAIDDPYNLAVALAYACITQQMREDKTALQDIVGELRELCGRYKFAYYREWALLLDGWSRPAGPGLALARQGLGNLKLEGSFARMPYWLSLLADILARDSQPGAARATLDAALIDGQARDDVWWLPEVMRMRAAYEDGPAAVTRLRAAAGLAATHGSVALLRRCERDLAERER